MDLLSKTIIIVPPKLMLNSEYLPHNLKAEISLLCYSIIPLFCILRNTASLKTQGSTEFVTLRSLIVPYLARAPQPRAFGL